MRSKRYTRKQALRDCLTLWETIVLIQPPRGDTIIKRSSIARRRVPEEWKREAAKEIESRDLGYLFLCPACYYNATHKRYYCGASCIIQWAKGSDGGCYDQSSPYRLWSTSITDDKMATARNYALAVCKLIRRELEKLSD